MSEGNKSFKVGIDFESVLRAISKQIYETPLAFIRENVQNAVDAIRIQALREGISPTDDRYGIDINVDGKKVTVRGIGMSAGDLESFFWTIGASGKRTKEAQSAGCVGMFGIGGFANFGVCDTLEVISQPAGATIGTLTRLSETDIQTSGAAIPSVTVEQSDAAAPRGTIVVGHMRNPPNVDELRRYLLDFVRYVPIKVYFGGQKLPQGKFSDIENRENMTEIRNGTQQWQNGDMVITGRLYTDRGYAIIAAIDGLSIGGESINLTGFLRFENGPIDVFKRGFKLCATQIGTTIGVGDWTAIDSFPQRGGIR